MAGTTHIYKNNGLGTNISGCAMTLLLAAFLFLSCSSIDCPVQRTVATYYTICHFDKGEAVAETLNDTLYVWTRQKTGNDTLLLNRGVNIKTFSLPISYQHPEDVLVFVVTDTLKRLRLDTVWVQKEDIPHFESVDCPAQFFHRITGVRSTHNVIDSIAIDNLSVSYDTEVNNFYISFK